MRRSLVMAVAVVGGMWVSTSADEPKPQPGELVRAEPKAVSFRKDVAPLLKDACGSCHTGFKKKAGLDVTSYDSLMKFVKPGDPNRSKLHNALVGKDAKPMPPKNPLADDQVALIRAWIAAGAKKN